MPSPKRSPKAFPRIVSFILAASFGLLLYGCSVQAPPPPPVAPPPPPPPPVVEGPHQIGPAKTTTASFYAPSLSGHVTSSGEVYDPHELTAASRTLPIGCHARVTNLRNGKSVVVRINDHGPFVKGRGIDLSRAAAHQIGIDHRGIAKVRVARIEEKSGHDADSWDGDVDVRDSPRVTPVEYTGKPGPPATAAVATAPATTPDSANGDGSWSMDEVTPSP